ncbi:MAG TPA: hypothetical protein VIJ51_15780 [Solirubrobacteraceae bacterium]
MLRADKRTQIVRLPISREQIVNGRYAVQTGGRVLGPRWNKATLAELTVRQRGRPVAIAATDGRTLWHFHDAFYWDGTGLNAQDVGLLIRGDDRRQALQRHNARSMTRGRVRQTRAQSLR